MATKKKVTKGTKRTGKVVIKETIVIPPGTDVFILTVCFNKEAADRQAGKTKKSTKEGGAGATKLMLVSGESPIEPDPPG